MKLSVSGLVLLTGCLISPVVRFGEGKTAKQAQRDTMADYGAVRLASGEKWSGEVATKRVRVWADDQYRAQNIHWQQTFTETLELTNVVFEPLVGVHLVPDFKVWERDVPGATLTDAIMELQQLDNGQDVFAVIGLTSSLPLVSSTFDELGLAMLNGRHIMLRGYADLEERKMYANAFPDLRAEERELALEHLRHHKTAVVLLHELGHILGVDHETDNATIMNASYSSRATAFTPTARKTMVASVDERLRRGTPAPAPVVASAPVQPQQKVPPVAAPPAAPVRTVQHAPIRIRVTKKRETIVDGKRLDSAALSALLQATYAEDPSTKIIISEDRHVPTGVVSALIDQLSAIGFTKAEFAWSGK